MGGVPQVVETSPGQVHAAVSDARVQNGRRYRRGRSNSLRDRRRYLWKHYTAGAQTKAYVEFTGDGFRTIERNIWYRSQERRVSPPRSPAAPPGSHNHIPERNLAT